MRASSPLEAPHGLHHRYEQIRFLGKGTRRIARRKGDAMRFASLLLALLILSGCGQSPGPIGPVGPAGPQGVSGPQGATGAQGPPGRQVPPALRAMPDCKVPPAPRAYEAKPDQRERPVSKARLDRRDPRAIAAKPGPPDLLVLPRSQLFAASMPMPRALLATRTKCSSPRFARIPAGRLSCKAEPYVAPAPPEWLTLHEKAAIACAAAADHLPTHYCERR